MNVSITEIKIGNLDVDNVIPLVAEALRMDDDDDKVKSLGKTIHKKTEGNPFFVLIFLRSLYDEKLLQYNFGALKWTWDEEAVNAKIVTENVASVLVNKMNRLQGETQRMLMVASCLGATFRLPAALEVMKNISQAEMRVSMRESTNSFSDSLLPLDMSVFSTDQDGSDCSYASSIEEMKEEGLCELDNEECHFVHDQIQSAAFELLCPDQRDSFRGRIGSILLHSLSPEELEASLFEVVALLNCAVSTITDNDRDELAKLNLKAGIKAAENAAFDAAKDYFEAGREALGSRGWEGDHRTMLDLCSHGASACYILGDSDSMNMLIGEVLSKDITMREKYRASDIKIKSFVSAEKWDDAIDTALNFIRQLGLPTLKKKQPSKFTIIKEYIRVKRLLKNKTAEDIVNLPRLDNELYEMGQRMTEHVSTIVFHVEPMMVPLLTFQTLTTSLKHGIDSTSPPALAGLGLMLCGPFGKPHEGIAMAKAAELILEKHGTSMRRSASYTLFVTNTFCYHWTSPLHETIAPLLKGYQIGLETGLVDRACWCLMGRTYHQYFIGRPLDSMQKEIEASITVLTQLKQDKNMSDIIVLSATVKKLRGIDAEESDRILDSMLESAASSGNVALVATVNVLKLEVFVLFQEWKEAIDLVRKASNVRQILPCAFTTVRYTFLEALTYLKAAQSSSRWKMRQIKKCAQKTIQIICGWANNGNVNVVHYLYILEAEFAVLNGKKKQAEEKFIAAIATSSRNGLIQDKALAHELASAFFQAQGDDRWAKYHIDCSNTCYQEWKCSGKVEQLSSMSI